MTASNQPVAARAVAIAATAVTVAALEVAVVTHERSDFQIDWSLAVLEARSIMRASGSGVGAVVGISKSDVG